MIQSATLLLLFTLSIQALAGSPPDAQIEAELRAITSETIEAVKRGDRAFFERLLAEEYLGTSTQGRVLDKAEYLAVFSPPPASMKPEFEVVDVRVHAEGELAVMSSRRNFRAVINGRPISASERTTQVFRRHDGRWLLVAEHSSPIADTPPKD